MEFIPVNVPLLNGNEKKYLIECIDSGWVSSEGPFVRKFEDQFAERVGRKYGVAVSNGSVALDLAVLALDIGAGDEVIMPTFTIISCAAAIIRAGAKPILVDCDPATWNMQVEHIESLITPQTKAIMVVHIYGLPVDMKPVLALAEKYGLKIIEDAAEMIGQDYQGKPCGSFGDVSTFSFYPNKHITTGEGGMVVTNSEVLAEKCRGLRNLCFQTGHERFIHKKLGFNYRITNMQAALGVAQLESLERNIEKKRIIGRNYNALLGMIPGIELPLPATNYAENIYWVYGIILKEAVPFDAEEAMRRLDALKIGTRPFFGPMHLQPILKEMGFCCEGSFPVAERIYNRGFYLPSGIPLSNEQQEAVADAVKTILL